MSMMRKAKKVVVAIDESAESAHALEWALEHLVEQPDRADDSFPGDTLVLLHSQPLPYVFVTDPGIVGYGTSSMGAYSAELLASMKQQQAQDTTLLLESAKTVCSEKNIKAVSKVLYGDPRDNLCDFVEENHADLLVMGSHGYGVMKRALLGSVSDYCAHNAKCPVLVVKRY